jgi:hypothetical protein
MSAPTSAPVADDKSSPAQSAVDELPVQIEDDTERTKSSLARLTSHSIDRLERLMSEIQEMREFLISEGERVQRATEPKRGIGRDQDQSRDCWPVEKHRNRWRGTFWRETAFQRTREAQTVARAIEVHRSLCAPASHLEGAGRLNR